jgi:hypothetical protein
MASCLEGKHDLRKASLMKMLFVELIENRLPVKFFATPVLSPKLFNLHSRFGNSRGH